AQRGYIRKDDIQKAYTFWTVGKSLADIEKKLTEMISNAEVDWGLISSINSSGELQRGRHLGPIEVQHGELGAPEDWAAEQKILTLGTFTANNLQRLAPRFSMGPSGLVEGPRGVVIRLISSSDGDLDKLRSTAEEVVDSVGDDWPVPLVITIPSESSPQLLREILKEKALNAMTFDERKEFGEEMCETEKRQIKANIDRDIRGLCSVESIVVSSRYRTAANALPNLTVLSALNECYRLAYPYTPKFFTTYKSSSTKLRTAVESVAKGLASNRLGDYVQPNPVAKDLITKFLKPGSTGSWGVVGPDLRIQPPDKNTAEKAWQLLCDRLKPGSQAVPLTGVVLELMNPPFAYDYFQLVLMLCAWYGYYRHDIQMQKGNGRSCSFDDYAEHLNKPKDFLNQLCFIDQVQITRKNREHEVAEVKGIIEGVRDKVYQRPEAEEAQEHLKAFFQDDRNDSSLRDAAERAHGMLTAGLDLASKYDSTAAEIREAIDSATQVSPLISQLSTLSSPQLPHSTCVATLGPGVDELRNRVLEKMTEIVTAQCAKLQEIKDVGQHGQNEQSLKSIHRQLKKNGLTQYITTVDSALEELAACRHRLDAVEEDKVIEAKATAIQTTSRLARLQDDSRILCELKPVTEAVEALVEMKKVEIEAEIAALVSYAQELPSHV
ncbi:MAG: hypothetical protein WCL39_14490, partial [Armatimonadota bacterium]